MSKHQYAVGMVRLAMGVPWGNGVPEHQQEMVVRTGVERFVGAMAPREGVFPDGFSEEEVLVVARSVTSAVLLGLGL